MSVTRPSVINAEAVLLAVSDMMADLAEGVGRAADRSATDAVINRGLAALAKGLQAPLCLMIGDQVWHSDLPMDPAAPEIVHGAARLCGVPDAVPKAVRQSLTSLLRAAAAQIETADTSDVLRRAVDKAEAKVSRRDQLLRGLFDLSPVGVVLIDYATARIIEVNTAFQRFGAWSREELIGVPILSFLPADHAAVVSQAVMELEEGGQFGPYDQRFIRPDGTGFASILRGLVLKSGGGQKIVWLLVEDVSALRARLDEVQAVRDEALLARAELKTAIEVLPHGFALYDADDRIVMVNDQMAAIYPELAPLMKPGTPYVDVLRAGTKLGLWACASGEDEALVAEVMARRKSPILDRLVDLKSGTLLRVMDRLTPNGGRVSLRIDVTAERDQEKRLAAVIEGSQAGTWECNFLTWENRVNERWAGMLGWTCAELEPITLLTWQELLHPDDLAPTMARLMQVMRQETEVFDAVFRLRHRAGHWLWVQSRGIVSLRDADGVPKTMSGVHVDVSALKAAEQRLEQIIEGAEVGTWHHDMQQGICHVNALWVRMLGYTLEELSPVTDAVWQGLLHPDDWAALKRNMHDRFARNIWQFQDELRLRHKDGHWVWIASRGQVSAWDAEGRPTATTGVHIDISARKKLEGDLEAERDFLATLTETSGAGILAVDGNARIKFFNREVQEIFELPPEALLNQICDPVLLGVSDAHGVALPFAGLPCQLALASGQMVRDLRLRVAMPDGRIKVLSVNAAVLPDPGMAARVVCTLTDVTQTAQAEDDLRAAIHKAEAANRAKSQFLANMSHELRTPLNGVLGMAELLADGVLDQKQRVMLDAIRESGVHLLSVVNDLLDLAKIESGKLALEVAPLSPRELAARIEAMHGIAARRKEVALTVTLGPGADRARMGDAKRLLQVMHNLVGNAVKFTEAGQVTVSIDEAAPGAGHLVVTVSDTGIGMSEDQSALVFEEFIQGDGSITRRFGGTGLGLPIVRRLVALMGGEISLVSAAGKGTTVTVTLPLPPAPVALAAPEQLSQLPDLTGLRCLLAEDNPTNRLIMRAMLNRLGIAVTLVCDGDEAVEKWAPGRFDLILLDISMPRKDGVTALTELRAKAGQGELPATLAVTAHAMEQNVQDYRAAGFAEVVTKPVTLDALAQAIRRTRHGVSVPPSPVAPLH